MLGKDVVVLWLRKSVAGPSPPRQGLDQMGFEVNKMALGQVNPWYSSVSMIPPVSHSHSSIIELTRSNHTERSAVFFWSQAYIISSRQQVRDLKAMEPVQFCKITLRFGV